MHDHRVNPWGKDPASDARLHRVQKQRESLEAKANAARLLQKAIQAELRRMEWAEEALLLESLTKGKVRNHRIHRDSTRKTRKRRQYFRNRYIRQKIEKQIAELGETAAPAEPRR